MDLNRAKKIFEEIKDLKIELIRDPASLGPDYLRENIALCRNYLNKVSYFFQEAMEEDHVLNMQLDELESQFAIEHDDMLVNDNRVKHLPAVEDREAMVNVLLSKRVRDIKRTKREITNLKHIEKVIRHRKQELDNTMSTLRLQSSLLRDQLRSGLSYGDESEREEKARRAKDGDDVDLDAILDESAAELEGENALVQNIEDDEESEDEDDDLEDEEESEDEDDDLEESEDDEEPESEEEPEESDGMDDIDALVENLDDDLDTLASEVKAKKSAKKSQPKPEPKIEPKTAAELKDEEESNALDDLEDLIASGGVDGVPEQKSVEAKSPAQDVGDTPKANPNPLKEEDIDPDMQSFLDDEPGDGLDEILAGI